jgi:hypothetical protein
VASLARLAGVRGSRQAFVSKCAALLQKRVCVSIVDLVTTRHFNLYSELLELISQSDPAFAHASRDLRGHLPRMQSQ